MKSATSSRPTRLVLIGVLVALAAMVLGVGTAFSKAVVAAPTLTSTPAAFSASTSASFSFTGPTGATFTCSLDGAAFSACTNPRAYTGLSQGQHAFAVKAVVGRDVSDPTSHSWVVDTTAPPAPTLSNKPATLSNTSSPSFSFTDADASAIFTCSVDGATANLCTSPKAYAGLAQGSHTFAVTAVDPAGNKSSSTAYAWKIDSIAPPAPVLITKPSDPTYNATNTFAWTWAATPPEDGATIQCSLENGAWFACSSPYTWVIATTNFGQHQFAVRAVDAAGNAGVTSYSFKYEKNLATSGMPFTIGGTPSSLPIGVWMPIPLTLTNPNNVTIYVSAVTVSVAADSTPSGCSGASNIELKQAAVTSTSTVPVPANGSVTLPAAQMPQIRLKNLPMVNQDVCKGKTFALSYSGTANN